MKTYIALLLGCTLASAAAIADNASDQPETVAPTPEMVTEESGSSSLDDMAVDDIEGLTVTGRANQKLGDVDEVVVDGNHRKLVVIGLDDDTREVAVPLNRFRLADGGHTLDSDLTMAELAGLPDYDPGDMESAEE